MYAQGRGVLQDFIQAHMWYNLSAARGEDRSAEARDALAKQMTPGQICRSAAAGSRMEVTRREITEDRLLVALSIEPTQLRSNPSADTLS